MNIDQWLKKVAAGKNIIISPMNDLALALQREVVIRGGKCTHFTDSFKQSADIIPTSQLTENDIVLINSPNHWQSISQSVKPAQSFVFSIQSDIENIEPADSFTGYQESNVFNTLFGQRCFWENHLTEYMTGTPDFDNYGFAWGDPEKEDDVLGNYKSISSKLQQMITPDSHVLELGTLGGKWTKYLFGAEKVTCVDINDVMIEAIGKRYPAQAHKVNFYISKGDELAGIEDKSINLLFCIDTLVRSSESIINAYFEEFSRVLSDGGHALIHLPSDKVPGSIERGFTNIDVENLLLKYQSSFSEIKVDTFTLTHGALVGLIK